MKTIRLARDRGTALIDDCDFAAVSEHKWRLSKGYAIATIGGKVIKMHRFILGLTDPTEFVDHEDDDRLNNQRSNLRVCSVQMNTANSRKRENSSSQYKGVQKFRNRWRVNARYFAKSVFCRDYLTEVEAARARNLVSAMIHGEFARLNDVEMNSFELSDQDREGIYQKCFRILDKRANEQN